MPGTHGIFERTLQVWSWRYLIVAPVSRIRISLRIFGATPARFQATDWTMTAMGMSTTFMASMPSRIMVTRAMTTDTAATSQELLAPQAITMRVWWASVGGFNS